MSIKERFSPDFSNWLNTGFHVASHRGQSAPDDTTFFTFASSDTISEKQNQANAKKFKKKLLLGARSSHELNELITKKEFTSSPTNADDQREKRSYIQIGVPNHLLNNLFHEFQTNQAVLGGSANETTELMHDGSITPANITQKR